MFDLVILREVLMKSLIDDSNLELSTANPAKGQDSIISQLIHDIYGGEILKSRNKRGWHFYNRIEGLHIDLTRLKVYKKRVNKSCDTLSSPGETQSYFAKEDYSNFYMRFVKIFEETLGLNKYLKA